MSIYIGNCNIKEIYYGSTKIKQVYYGSQLVFDGEGGGDPTPVEPEVTKWSGQFTINGAPSITFPATNYSSITVNMTVLGYKLWLYTDGVYRGKNNKTTTGDLTKVTDSDGLNLTIKGGSQTDHFTTAQAGRFGFTITPTSANLTDTPYSGSQVFVVQQYPDGGSHTLTFTQKAQEQDIPGDYVDLGLPSGTIWYRYNIEEESEEGYGYRYQFGADTGYADGTNSSWQTSPCNGGSLSFNNTAVTEWDTENVDNTTLALDTTKVGIDAALAYDNFMRIPTKEQWSELISNTDMEFDESKNGWMIYNKTDHKKWMFLPFAGIATDGKVSATKTTGYYMSSSVTGLGQSNIYCIVISLTTKPTLIQMNRYQAMSIRPVYYKSL